MLFIVSCAQEIHLAEIKQKVWHNRTKSISGNLDLRSVGGDLLLKAWMNSLLRRLEVSCPSCPRPSARECLSFAEFRSFAERPSFAGWVWWIQLCLQRPWRHQGQIYHWSSHKDRSSLFASQITCRNGSPQALLAYPLCQRHWFGAGT